MKKLHYVRAKTNILNENERVTCTMNEYSNILSVFQLNYQPNSSCDHRGIGMFQVQT